MKVGAYDLNGKCGLISLLHYLCLCVMRERDTHTHTQIGRDKETGTETETDRLTSRERLRQTRTDKDGHRQRGIQIKPEREFLVSEQHWLMPLLPLHYSKSSYVFNSHKNIIFYRSCFFFLFTSNILKHLEKNRNYARVLFIDFSSAFNTIQPHVMVQKLKDLNVRNDIIALVLEFLTHRRQYVKLNDSLSGLVQILPKSAYCLQHCIQFIQMITGVIKIIQFL